MAQYPGVRLLPGSCVSLSTPVSLSPRWMAEWVQGGVCAPYRALKHSLDSEALNVNPKQHA